MNRDNISNPLSNYNTYSIKHILVAYKYSEDAYAAVGFKGVDKQHGDMLADGGIVLINELSDSALRINHCDTVWSYYSQFSSKSTEYVGTMDVIDTSGTLFAESLKTIASTLETSIHHLTIAWYTMFYDNDTASFQPNPLYFHITKYAQNISGVAGRLYRLNFAACYNTHGLMPQYSRLYQTTITHKDSSLNDVVPIPVAPSSGIVPTRVEDSKKLTLRQTRLNKVKYMKTIGDVFNGLEMVLDNQKVSHKNPLQKFMTIIRDEYVDKLTLAATSNEILPIDFSIKVDPAYKNRNVNNRNLPFEQYEVEQNVSGISTLTLPVGSTILHAVTSIMKLSKEIAEEHSDVGAISYKITTTTNRVRNGQYKINIKITPHVVPRNSDTEETAPGVSMINADTGVIEFVYDNVNVINNNVIAVSFSTEPTIKFTTKDSIDSQPDANDIYGNREAITSNRFKAIGDFFKNGFSGLATMVSEMTNNGLQDATAATSLSTFNEMQQTSYVLSVTGNPFLLNDINRNPMDVINNKTKAGNGHYIIYGNVESDPMYVKLNIFVDSNKVERSFFQSGYVHLYKIHTVFYSGQFSQMLYCARTDDTL